MSAEAPSPETAPFIAWSFAQDYNAPSVTFRRSCEKHIQNTLTRTGSMLGGSAVEGIIIYDRLERGAAVAAILGRDGKTLPESTDGEVCDSHFDEDDLCSRTNEHSLFSRIHEGSRGMLISLKEDTTQRLILLDQRQAHFLHPMGLKKDFERGLGAVGLLAHEMAHARDYADGRPGQPSLAEIAAQCPAQHTDAIHTIADMALAEYVATRAECAVQVSLHKACSADLTARAETMARQNLDIPALDALKIPADYDPEQRRMDLSHTGYVIGTLAAYANADAPVIGKNKTLLRKTTADQVWCNAPKNSTLGALLSAAGPALERAATTPDKDARQNLAKVLETTLISARSVKQERARPQKKDSSFCDWFDER